MTLRQIEGQNNLILLVLGKNKEQVNLVAKDLLDDKGDYELLASDQVHSVNNFVNLLGLTEIAAKISDCSGMVYRVKPKNKTSDDLYVIAPYTDIKEVKNGGKD